MSEYEKLVARGRELAVLGSTASVLSWDQETYLPPAGVAFRAEQMAELSSLAHTRATAPEIGEWLASCEGANGKLDPLQRANVREWRRDYDKATRLPNRLVKELTEATSLARERWVAARQERDFEQFRPALEKVLALTHEKADCLREGKDGLSAYDALLDEYEPGAEAEALRPVFAELRDAIVELLPAALAISEQAQVNRLRGDYPQAKQEEFNRAAAMAIGFDFDAGRIDTTTHPFCTGLGPRDVRLTTRYDERDFTSSFFGVLHEVGHGLYGQGLRADAFGTPAGEDVSLGIHESQSRLWENQVGRSEAFWRVWYPTAREVFGNLEGLEMDEFLLIVNRVEPSYIRVEADELTYNLHIILRFELEQALFDGSLAVADLPGAWNEKFESMFGFAVDHDSNGCLQDVHWSLGALGYFPTYTLGNLNAAQLFDAAREQIEGFDAQLATGDYSGLLAWLRENVHEKGRTLSPDELMRAATGRPTEAHHLVSYLRQKYAEA
ncbi:MAG: carboxypeptidase M32 [Verrucomicrobiota bacterium]